MHHESVPWLEAARQWDVDEVLRVAEEFECSWPRAELSPCFFRVLVTAHLIQNDVVNAVWALQRCATTMGVDWTKADALWTLLEQTVHCCRRSEYEAAFQAFLPTCGGYQGEDMSVLESCLLDHLAARHYRRQLAILGRTDGVDMFAAALGVTPDDLALRLRRVREFEARHVERELAKHSSREMLSCMLLAGRVT